MAEEILWRQQSQKRLADWFPRKDSLFVPLRQLPDAGFRLQGKARASDLGAVRQ
ncbi:MAG: hypothetical protein ACM3KE_16960 [Hyphomicrobiales bacterium]